MKNQKRQKAIIVHENITRELDKLLDSGWKVVHTCAMPSSVLQSEKIYGISYPPQCLVVLEK
jgi:hypothetical protein